jgi:hypothetical protein
MIIIKTKQGDTIEIHERKLWEDENSANFGTLCMNIRCTGYLMTPELYIESTNILMIVRSPNPNTEGPETRQ